MSPINSLVCSINFLLNNANPYWYAWVESEEIFCVSIRGCTKDFSIKDMEAFHVWVKDILTSV